MGLIDQFSPGFLLILAFSLGKGSSLYSLSIFCLSSSRVKLDLRSTGSLVFHVLPEKKFLGLVGESEGGRVQIGMVLVG